MVSELVRADPFSHYSPKEQDPLSFTEIDKRLNENTIDYSNQNRCANCYTKILFSISNRKIRSSSFLLEMLRLSTLAGLI